MAERVSFNRINSEKMLGYGKHLLKLSINYNSETEIPKITLGKSKTAFIHNIKIKQNKDGITILYFETNGKYIEVYDTQSTLLAVSSPESLKSGMDIPNLVITFELIDLVKTEHLHSCVISQIKNQYHCAFIPFNKCILT